MNWLFLTLSLLIFCGGCLKVKMISPAGNIQSTVARPDSSLSTLPTSISLKVTEGVDFQITLIDTAGFPIVGARPTITQVAPSTYPAPQLSIDCGTTDSTGYTTCSSLTTTTPGDASFNLNLDGWSHAFTIQVNCPVTWAELGVGYDFSTSSNMVDSISDFELLRCNQPGDVFHVGTIDFSDTGYVFHPVNLSDGVKIYFHGALKNITISNHEQYSNPPTFFGESLTNVTLDGLIIQNLNYNFNGVVESIIANSVTNSNIVDLQISHSKFILQSLASNHSTGLFNNIESTSVSFTISNSILKTNSSGETGFLAANCTRSGVASPKIQGQVLDSLIFSSGDTGMLCGHLSDGDYLFDIDILNSVAISVGTGKAVGGLIGKSIGTTTLSNILSSEISDFTALSPLADRSGVVGGLIGNSDNVDHFNIAGTSITRFKAIGGTVGGFFGDGTSFSSKSWLVNSIDMDLSKLDETIDSVVALSDAFGTVTIPSAVDSASHLTLQSWISFAGGFSGVYKLAEVSPKNIFDRFKINFKGEHTVLGYKGGFFGKINVSNPTQLLQFIDLDLTTDMSSSFTSSQNFSPLSPITNGVSPAVDISSSIIKNEQALLSYGSSFIMNAPYSSLSTQETYLAGGLSLIDCTNPTVIVGYHFTTCDQVGMFESIHPAIFLDPSQTSILNFDFTTVWNQADGTNYVQLK